MDDGSTFNGKLSALSVDEDSTRGIGQLPEDVRSNERAGGKICETDPRGEELRSIDSGGRISGAKNGDGEEGLIGPLRGSSCSFVREQKTEEDDADPVDGPPGGFFFIFPYVDLKSLFTLERVSKLVRSGVNDVLVWTKLLVGPPLSRKLSNDLLLSLVKRAEGNLKCLSLTECLRIRDDTLAQVLSLSPQLEKLCVPGCTGLSADGIVSLVEQHAKEARAKGMSGIKQLRVRGIYNMTQQHLNALRAIALSGRGQEAENTIPVYCHMDPISIAEDERVIDVEICPRCKSESPTVVYDCTKESCQNLGRHDRSKACRGCIMCLPRCVACGTCLLKDEEWEKTCCSDVVCLTCWLHLPKCSECQNAFCRRHKLKVYVRDPGGPRICEDCLIYGSQDDSSLYGNYGEYMEA